MAAWLMDHHPFLIIYWGMLGFGAAIAARGDEAMERSRVIAAAELAKHGRRRPGFAKP